MTHRILLSFLAALLMAPMAEAACYADYKAKRDNPLRLHYGVAQVSTCSDPGRAAQEIAPRLRADGWQLLNIVSVFDDAGLQERKASAGRFFLRY